MSNHTHGRAVVRSWLLLLGAIFALTGCPAPSSGTEEPESETEPVTPVTRNKEWFLIRREQSPYYEYNCYQGYNSYRRPPDSVITDYYYDYLLYTPISGDSTGEVWGTLRYSAIPYGYLVVTNGEFWETIETIPFQNGRLSDCLYKNRSWVYVDIYHYTYPEEYE